MFVSNWSLVYERPIEPKIMTIYQLDGRFHSIAPYHNRCRRQRPCRGVSPIYPQSDLHIVRVFVIASWTLRYHFGHIQY